MNKKKPSIVLLACGCLAALSACGGTLEKPGSSSDKVDDTSGSVPSDGKTHVKFWHTMGKVNQDLLRGMIKAFQQQNPNIVIDDLSAAGGYDELQNLILNNVATGNLPTMSFCYPDNVAEYLDRNCVVDMSSYIDDAELGFKEEDGKSVNEAGEVRVGKADFVKTFWDEGCEYTKSGVYSLPFAKSTEALFYNKTVFDQNGWTVPTTWAEMWDLCAEIRAAYPEKKGDEYVYFPLGYDSDSNLFISMAQQMGYDYTTNDPASESHFVFDNDGIKGMLNMLKGYYDLGYFKTKGTSANATYTSSRFTAGEIFMSIGSTGGTTYNSTNDFEVGVVAPPSIDVDHPAVISQGPSVCFYNRSTEEERRAAWKFYRFVTNSTNTVVYGLSTGYQPVRYSSYDTDAYKDYIEDAVEGDLLAEVAKLSSTMLEDYFTSPVFLGSALARTEVGKALSSVLIGSKSVEKALSDAMANCVNQTRN